VFVSQRSELGDNDWKVGVRFQEDVEINDGLCRQSRNGRAANVLDGSHQDLEAGAIRPRNASNWLGQCGS
jgi:hypothetical protein